MKKARIVLLNRKNKVVQTLFEIDENGAVDTNSLIKAEGLVNYYKYMSERGFDKHGYKIEYIFPREELTSTIYKRLIPEDFKPFHNDE